MSTEKCSDLHRLQSAIEDMDCIASDAFGQIAASIERNMTRR